MNLIYLTGSSSGLGKALAELLLEDKNNHVVGIARRETIHHERYTHYALDLKEVINKNIFQKPSHTCEKGGAYKQRRRCRANYTKWARSPMKK